jgi:hypothetical protein
LAGFLLATTEVLAQPAVPVGSTIVPAASSSLAGTAGPASVAVLSDEDVSLYKEIMAVISERGEGIRPASSGCPQKSAILLVGICASPALSCRPRHDDVTLKPLVECAESIYRELGRGRTAVYRLAVARSDPRKVRPQSQDGNGGGGDQHSPYRKGVGKRTGGYEDLELPGALAIGRRRAGSHV